MATKSFTVTSDRDFVGPKSFTVTSNRYFTSPGSATVAVNRDFERGLQVNSDRAFGAMLQVTSQRDMERGLLIGSNRDFRSNTASVSIPSDRFFFAETPPPPPTPVPLVPQTPPVSFNNRFPCPNAITCPGTDSPVLNTSSEAIDYPDKPPLDFILRGITRKIEVISTHSHSLLSKKPIPSIFLSIISHPCKSPSPTKKPMPTIIPQNY